MTAERVEVRLHDRPVSRVVGTLLDVGTGPHFRYDPAFLGEGIELSPFHLKGDTRVFSPTEPGLHRLPGLFYDTLPDGWGLRLLHQAMKDAGLPVTGSSAVTWLRALGARGMGALTFHPSADDVSANTSGDADLATLAAEARRVDADAVEEVLPALTRAGGSSGGARPKIVAGWNDTGSLVDAFDPLPEGYRPVLIKFAANSDPADAPLVEAAYLTMARQAGLDVPNHRVHPIPGGRWAFVVDRFDRVGDDRRHVHTLAGLRQVNIKGNDVVDYEHLLRVTRALANDHRAVRAAWQRAAFNVAVHNRDDHAKNIAFQMAPDGTWTLAPAYDLTYALGPGGQHTMLVNGEGRAPDRTHLMELAETMGLDAAAAATDLDRLRTALDDWSRIAASFDVPKKHITALKKILVAQSALLAP